MIHIPGSETYPTLGHAIQHIQGLERELNELRCRQEEEGILVGDGSLAAAEKIAVIRALRQTPSKRAAARLLKIGKTTLYRKMEVYDIKHPPELTVDGDGG